MSTGVCVAKRDPALSARIMSRRSLSYSRQASTVLDRPPFVRAASGIAWFEGRLAIIQDDASFIALVDPVSASVDALPLLAGHDGLRHFDKARGNKKHKLDLECCFSAEIAGESTLFALGSGSSPRRERIIVVRALRGGYDSRAIEARALYAAFRKRQDFSGSELNLEGATVVDDKLILFQRGNGDKDRDLPPLDATCALSLADVVNYIDDIDNAALPTLEDVVQHDLGAISGTRLTFTDACAAPGRVIVYLASAEASPNSIEDGLVAGAAVGRFRDGSSTLALLVDENGEPCRDKVEGIVLDVSDPSRAWVVVDPDEHQTPASLLEVKLTGPWT